MERDRRHSTDVRAGCFVCHGVDAHWTASNGLMLAARHHDTTGHPTWAEQQLSLRWGEHAPDPAQLKMFEDAR